MNTFLGKSKYSIALFRSFFRARFPESYTAIILQVQTINILSAVKVGDSVELITRQEQAHLFNLLVRKQV